MYRSETFQLPVTYEHIFIVFGVMKKKLAPKENRLKVKWLEWRFGCLQAAATVSFKKFTIMIKRETGLSRRLRWRVAPIYNYAITTATH